MESNLIYRDVTVALLKEEEYPCENDYDEGYMAALDKAIWIVEKYTASAIPKQRWIPCSERLPEKAGKYLVSVRNGNVYAGIFDKYSGKFQCAAIAWMPLPEPYQEEEK